MQCWHESPHSCVSVFLNRSRRQEDTDGLWLSTDGSHHVCTDCHAVHHGSDSHSTPQYQSEGPDTCLHLLSSLPPLTHFPSHAGSELLDPVCEHRPDILCYLHLRTRTLWVFRCLLTFQTTKHSSVMYSMLYSVMFSWCVYGSSCWPLPTSVATFCLRDQWDDQLARHVRSRDVFQLYSGEIPIVQSDLLYIFMYITFTLVFVCPQDGLGQYCFLIFAVYSIFSAAFMIRFVPETKGKAMTEIMEDFNKLNYKNRDIALETQF